MPAFEQEWNMRSLCSLLVLLTLSGCVQVDPDTGQTLPRGEQKYEFETVTRRAEQLQSGMSRLNVLLLLGQPAEKSADGNTWIYLPERPAVLIPSRALRLVFENDSLVRHSYRAIVLGQPL